ncbi:alpha/beta fold hydrolase [Novosphingobium album (ex Liu et al. 2023)]|uniref:Alpha/beta hydrolase n=1 Tax=Novosphingobium album (ex Liu et al. 2023) TaxID=3031130 RepID=A0ABT5WSN6_9SPHN|nr:alpha/beta hydrolase [Novosphingobium album (ex Liu et al. 2023)]MDE8653061.1 alpha/beta hydrolase [Novosphingobium album (ex Liu et al. 2023)]
MTNPIVFLHGGGQGGWVWDEAIAAIGRQSHGQARCLALDVPGCGAKRGRKTDGIAFEDIARELIADIEAAGLGDVVLVGHSQAGTVLPVIAALRPDLLRKLVFVTCIAPDPGLTIIEMTTARMREHDQTAATRALTDTTLPERERYRIMFCNDMAQTEADAFLDKLGGDRWPRSAYEAADWAYDHLAAIPVSYVLCLRDAILPLAWQEHFATRMRARATPRIDAGHQVMNTRPQELAQVLLAEAAS